MNILDKFRTLAEQTVETSALRGIFGKNTLPKERIPWVNMGNHGSDSGSSPNDTGIKGYFTQKVINLLLGNSSSDAGELLLGYILNNSANKNNTGASVGALMTNGGTGYTPGAGIPTVVVTLQGVDAAVGSIAVAPAYTAVVGSDGKVASLTQTLAGSNLTQIPLITFTGGSGSGAAAYIILDNNYLDEKFINPNGGVLSKVTEDLKNNYLTSSQTNALLVNQLQVPNWFEDFDGGIGSSIAGIGTTNNIAAGAISQVSNKGWVVQNGGSISNPIYYTDYHRNNNPSGNIVAGDLPPGVLTFAGTANALGINQILANISQEINANYAREISFRFRLATVGGGFAGASALYFGLTGSAFASTTAAFLANAVYFSTASGNTQSGSINVNFGTLSTQPYTSATAGSPATPGNFNTYKIVYTGTQFIFYINNVQILNPISVSSTTKVYPFMAVSGIGGTYGSNPIAIDYINNKVTLPNLRS